MEHGLSLLAVLVLAIVHLFSGRLRFLEGTPRARWLSAAGGVSVAYVFVHLLPELSETQEAVREATEGALGFLDNHVYVLALLGLVVFYGLERAALTSRSGGMGEVEDAQASPGVFWLHIASFSLYNAVIGYLLLHREEGGLADLFVFALAMALHFVLNDRALREHHKGRYRSLGRWVITGALFAGWLLAAISDISEQSVRLLLAFLSGGIVLNVLKEELPEERRSRFPAFALGAAAYTLLLLLI